MAAETTESVGQPETGSNEYADMMRGERDRFVAFAFCAADLLLEANAEFEIMFCAGATQSLVGKPPEQLIGKKMFELIAPNNRPLVTELLHGLVPGSRMDPVWVKLNGTNGQTPALSVTGYHLPDLSGSYYFALRLGARGIDAGRMGKLDRDGATGLLGPNSFTEIASEQMLEAGQRGEKLKMTMVRAQDLEALRTKLDKEASESLMRTLGACLLASSVSGQTAGRVADEAFGVVHKHGDNIDEMVTRTEDIFRAADPAGVGISIYSGTVDADVEGMSAEDLEKVLRHTVKAFTESDGASLDMDDLSQKLQSMTKDTATKMNTFRRLVAEAKFGVVFQPIVSLETWEIQHYEALVRFIKKDGHSPYELITFAEKTGFISEFDLAMCRKVLKWVNGTNRMGQRYAVAINLSGHSIAQKSFVKDLHELLTKFDPLRDQIYFEITESARIEDLEGANEFIQGLREIGHKVCLDDFGAGSAALKYLHALEVDVVKIDGQYVRSAMLKRRFRSFLKAMVALCHDLGVVTVAEMVEDEACVAMLRECGVEQGQGFLFGRPSFNITDFEKTEEENDEDEFAAVTAEWKDAQGE